MISLCLHVSVAESPGNTMVVYGGAEYILCPVGFRRLFAIVFECSIPDTLDDFSKFFSALFGGHKMESTNKYISIVVHIPI